MAERERKKKKETQKKASCAPQEHRNIVRCCKCRWKDMNTQIRHEHTHTHMYMCILDYYGEKEKHHSSCQLTSFVVTAATLFFFRPATLLKHEHCARTHMCTHTYRRKLGYGCSCGAFNALLSAVCSFDFRRRDTRHCCHCCRFSAPWRFHDHDHDDQYLQQHRLYRLHHQPPRFRPPTRPASPRKPASTACCSPSVSPCCSVPAPVR